MEENGCRSEDSRDGKGQEAWEEGEMKNKIKRIESREGKEREFTQTNKRENTFWLPLI